MKLALSCLVLASSFFFLPQPGRACTIPVYRYALERWELARYDVLIYHRGPLPAEIRAQVEKLRTTVAGNYEIVAVDLDGKVSPELLDVWKQQSEKTTFPWLVVRLRNNGPKELSAWTGPCSPQALAAAIDSPVRRAILESLASGHTAAFVVLESGDAEKDGAARRLLEEQLPRLEKEIKLPEQSKDGPQLQLKLPLQVRFTVHALPRAQAGEAAFVGMLLSSEEELAKIKGPIVFAIFGRGRLLGSLYGNDINAEQITEVARFLCKECSCRVKELNPGSDLLLAASWKALFEPLIIKDGETPPAKETAAGSQKSEVKENQTATLVSAPDSSPRPPASSPTPTPESRLPNPGVRYWLWLVLACMAVAVVYTCARVLSRPRV